MMMGNIRNHTKGLFKYIFDGTFFYLLYLIKKKEVL